MTQDEFNPYVGPRPFERKEEDSARFFGRTQEAEEIVSLIFGHPVILVYAQSGAGKTSLFNASVAPKLEENGFDVLPLTRVGGIVPKGMALQEIENLYIFNALLKVDTATDPRTLSSTSLCTFLETRPRTTDENGQPHPRVIIFDQFEELFTYTPEHWREQRDGFFLQVVEALDADPLLRVVFVIREDFLAELDPYSRSLPEHLRTRYRLERLGENAALRAIRDPLVNTNRAFAPGVAEGLVKELLATRTVDATGKTAEIEGQYVEPVQLQVVCVTLWASLEPDVTEIQETHLKNFNVNDALSNFYKSAIESAVKETGVPEADLRNWFGKILITPMGTRSTVFRGEDMTGDIQNGTVDFLESRHIIRAEFRAGARWYELTHDRLVEPIRKSNEEWFEKNSSLLQNQTALWVAHGRPDGMLLRGQELEQAELELAKRLSESKTITKDEQDFLAVCKRVREQERREKRLNRLIQVSAVLATVAFIATFLAVNTARQQTSVAKAESTHAASLLTTAEAANTHAASAGWKTEAEALAGQAQIALNSSSSDSSDDSRGELLAVEAYKANIQAENETLPSVYQALIDSVLKRNFTKIKDNSFSAASFSPDGNWLMVDDILWNLLNNQKPFFLDVGSAEVIRSAFASKEQAVFITDNPNYYSYYGTEQVRFTLHIFNINNPGNILSIPLKIPVDAYATDVDLSDDGNWAAVAYSYLQGDNENGGVNVWDIQDSSFQPKELTAFYIDGSDQKNPEVTSVALSADGTKLAAFDSANGFLNFWEYSTAKQDFDRINPKNNPQKVEDINFINGKFSGKSGRGLQYSPDGKWLVALTDTSKIYIYNAEKQAYLTAIMLEKENLVGLLFSPDNKFLIGVTSSYFYCLDNPSQNCQPSAALKRWKLGIEKPAPDVVFQSTTTDITALHVGNDGTIVIGDEAGYVRAWSPGEELQLIEDTYVHNGNVNGILVGGQDGKTIVSASEDDATLLWKLLQENVVVAVVIKRISNTRTSLVQAANGKDLAIGGSNPKSATGLVSLYSELQDLQDPKKLEELSFNSGPGSLKEVAVGNTWIAAGRICELSNTNYYLEIWSRDKSVSPISLQLDSEIGSLSFSPDEKYLAVAYNSGNVQILETASFKDLATSPTSANLESCPKGSPLSSLPQSALRELSNDLTLKSLQFAQNDNYNYLVGAGQQGVRIWNMNSFTIEGDLYNATYPVRISPDQKWLATGSSENAIQGSFTNAIQLYDLSNTHSSPTILPTAATITELAFSQDSKWLAAATKSREILIFNLLPVHQAVPSFTLTGFTKDITWLEFSPITSKVPWLAVSSGSKVFLYNMQKPDGTPLNLSHASTAYVDYVGFAKDGEWVVSAATDQTLWFWSLDPKTLSETACAYAGRNLSPSERTRYSIDSPTCSYRMEEPEEPKLDITPQPYPTAGVQLTPTSLPQTPTLSTTPTPTTPVITYTVQEGDTLTGIAAKYGINISTLAADNGITDTNQIRIGQILQIKIRNTPAAP